MTYQRLTDLACAVLVSALCIGAVIYGWMLILGHLSVLMGSKLIIYLVAPVVGVFLYIFFRDRFWPWITKVLEVKKE